jgi:hypothetical protein
VAQVAQVQQLAVRQRADQVELAATLTVVQVLLAAHLEAAALLTVVQVLLAETAVS